MPKLELLRALEIQRVPARPINEMHEVFVDPQIEARGLVIEQDLGSMSPPVKIIGILSDWYIDISREFPLLQRPYTGAWANMHGDRSRCRYVNESG